MKTGIGKMKTHEMIQNCNKTISLKTMLCSIFLYLLTVVSALNPTSSMVKTRLLRYVYELYVQCLSLINITLLCRSTHALHSPTVHSGGHLTGLSMRKFSTTTTTSSSGSERSPKQQHALQRVHAYLTEKIGTNGMFLLIFIMTTIT